jgi:hypothetical protein
MTRGERLGKKSARLPHMDGAKSPGPMDGPAFED